MSLSPFAAEHKQAPSKTSKPKLNSKKPKIYPSSKIEVIKSLSKIADLPRIGAAFDSFYRAGIRYSISHSDYIIHGDEFRMRGQTIPDDADKRLKTSIIKLASLQAIIDQAGAFYRAFVRVEKKRGSAECGFEQAEGIPL